MSDVDLRTSKVRFLLVGVLLGYVLFFAVSRLAAATRNEDDETIRRFNEIYWERHRSLDTSFLGVEVLQNPADQWMMQQIIAEVRPDFIIETGTHEGGTALYYAAVLEQVNPSGRVITVDVRDDHEDAARHRVFQERVHFIHGDSVSPEVISEIKAMVSGHRVLVTLDSLHQKGHVLEEMRLYSGFVSEGSYLVVQDTIIDKYPVMPEFGPGPMAAVREFLENDDRFEVDLSRERFLLTYYPSGYLKRVR